MEEGAGLSQQGEDEPLFLESESEGAEVGHVDRVRREMGGVV